MKKINWGIIGCGAVTEVKSGPALNKVQNSSLFAVMRRDGKKAEDYARRHDVPFWYSNADELITNPLVNAIYVATPPSTHEEYTIAAMRAGKPVYVEKPMALNVHAAKKMLDAQKDMNGKLVVAHYRRAQPYFKKIKELIGNKTIGDVKFVRLNFCKRSLTFDELRMPGNAWRVDPNISGGGMFYDLAPHHLDLMYYFFGNTNSVKGISYNQQQKYPADDIVTGSILFKNGIMFHGFWCFNAEEGNEEDTCEIVGTKGSITFSIFGEQQIVLTRFGNTETICFDPLTHVQQPMIEEVVKYFLNEVPNPCSGEDGVIVMEMMEQMTR